MQHDCINKINSSYRFAIVTFIILSKYEEQCKVVPKFKYAKFDMHDKGKEKERNVLVDVELCSHDKIKDDMIG